LLAVVILLLWSVREASGEDAATSSRDMGPTVISPDLPPEAPVRSDLDSYGGWLGLKGKATGFFHTEQLGGRWWLVTPEGHAFFMLQIGWTKKKDSVRLKSWGFNTSEKDTGMPYAVDVRFFRDVKRLFPIPQIPGAPPWWTFPDVFHAEWPQYCKERAQGVLGSRAQDPLMIGYFMENEVCLQGWYEAVTHAAKDAPCRAAFVEVARAYYVGKPDDLARDWQAFGVKKVEDLLGVAGTAPVSRELLDSSQESEPYDQRRPVRRMVPGKLRPCGRGRNDAGPHQRSGPRVVSAGVLAGQAMQ
jgi:hypothetical protein